ncbi:CapA family protein [Mesorhizobium shangrilense]|uniref:CapA family protein n=1 Tax=Mesorhizobium shangrilense TaxID=460060 RepID=A0ABV2DSP8_9HYPH
MGFNMLSRANNHTLDWGLEGMQETSRALDENGTIHAGAGENLAQAGAARFSETSRGGVALVSFCCSVRAYGSCVRPRRRGARQTRPQPPPFEEKHRGPAGNARKLEADTRSVTTADRLPGSGRCWDR